MTGERFTWRPEDVKVVRAADIRRCEACKVRPADDDQVPSLCKTCAASIDRDYEWLRDQAELEAGP